MTTTTEGLGDVEAALNFAADVSLADSIELNAETLLVRERNGADAGEIWREFDRRVERVQPRRLAGTIEVHDADSFKRALEQREVGAGPVMYADEENLALIAVLNDDHGAETGWRDYRVSLVKRPTPEWVAWTNGQGLGEQQRFAERIEDGLPEITSPAGATMLEIATSFQATIGVEFRQGQRLQDGQTQIAYVEDVKASAGSGSKAGTVTIPETFELALRPFIGATRYAVTARLRYRVSGGKLQIGYTLVRPDEVLRTAFAEVVAQVEELVGFEALRGPAPSPRS